MKYSLFALICALLLANLSLASDTIWVRRLDFGGEEMANGIASYNNNIAIVGNQYATTYDYLIVKYNQQGETLWTRTFDTGIDDIAIDASFDLDQNIFVTGYAYSLFSGQTKYSGLPHFAQRTVPFVGNVKIVTNTKATNYTKNQTRNALTIKYDSLGEFKWQKTENNKIAIGIATDSEGNSYVSGCAFTGFDYNFWLIKYDPRGETIWSRTLDFSIIDIGYRCAVDREGNVVIAGYSSDMSTANCFVFKFAPNGDTIWTRRFDLNLEDIGIGVATDLENNVIVAGVTGEQPNYDYLILKYDSAGNLIWSRTYHQATDNEALGVACDMNNNIFVTGISGESFSYDYLTIKYDASGNILWAATYDNGADDEGSDVTCDANGNPIVTGASQGFGYDFLTIKYRSEVGIEETNTTHYIFNKTPIRSKISNSYFIFDAQSSGNFKLSLYSPSGDLAKEVYRGFLNQGVHRFSLAGLTSGIHFLKVETPDRMFSVNKLVLVK